MSRSAPYLGIVTVVVVGVLVVILASKFAEESLVSSNDVSATPYALSVGATTSPKITLPNLIHEATVPSTTASTTAVVPDIVRATSTPAKKITKDSSQQKVLPVFSALPSKVQVATSSLDEVATVLRGALVNIMCYAPVGGRLRSISGSGIIIDPKGIILTNAHIAQYFLLTTKGVSCTIRTGSPAVDSYQAALIYISPLWIRANTTVLTQSAPTGTGEYDFALLGITKGMKSNVLPTTFPFISLAEQSPALGSPIVIASYGAQFLEASQIQSSLYPTIVFGSIKDIFTFAVNTIDVLALGGSPAAQEGSSGGGLGDFSGKLVGTITTSTIEGETSQRSLSAITASYIRAEYAAEMGSPLDLLLSEAVTNSVNDFSSQIPKLEAILTAQLQ